MDRTEELKQWFSIADGDVSVAEYLLAMRYPRPDNIICFHCQQAAEKYIKGFLLYKNIEFSKTHNLIKLLEIAKTNASDISILLDKCALLTQYAVETRYPNQREYTDEEVKLAIRYAKDIQAFIKELLGDSAGVSAVRFDGR